LSQKRPTEKRNEMACKGCNKNKAGKEYLDDIVAAVKVNIPAKKTLPVSNEQIKDLYQKFIALHPNSREAFTPSLGNLQRWHWHVNEASKRPKGEAVEVTNTSEAESIARGRAFAEFLQMPEYMRERYLQIAALFPGVQFYACGSRVTGEYIEKWSGIGIKQLRKALRKPDKEESDYDVCVSGIDSQANRAMIRKQLPKWADILNHSVPDNEKIRIPMWDFTRLPKHEHARVIELVDAANWGELMVIHNQYHLSHNVYCCDEKPVRRYFEWAIEQGIISKA